MKSLKYFLVFACITGFSNAATVTISSGLSTQGFTPSLNNVAIANFSFSVGNYNLTNSTFTQFGLPIADVGKVGGAGGITAFAPTSLNGLVVDLFVGTGSSIETSGTNWVVMRPSASTAVFPADVTGTGSVTVNATVPSGWTIIAKGDSTAAFGGAATGGGTILNLNAIPEPSAVLLGSLGALSLLRRRRN